MKRSPFNKIGKQAKRNITANKKIAELWQYHSIDYCEADFPPPTAISVIFITPNQNYCTTSHKLLDCV